MAREMLGWVHLLQGRLEDALSSFEEIVRRTDDLFKVIPHRAYTLTRMGREEEARQLFELLKERQRREPEVSLEMDFALIHLAFGEVEECLDYLERAADARLGSSIFIGSHIGFDGLRGHPRFRRLLERVGVRDPEEERDDR
jgi:tetratricopeptide (TPR) repeat protein